LHIYLKGHKNIANSAKPSGIPYIIVISIISILFLNAGLAPMQQQQQMLQQAYASAATIPKTSDLKRDIKQDIDQQNTCHRGDDCKQDDGEQQLQGKGNEANGFNDQSKNIQQQQQQQQQQVSTIPTPTPTTSVLTVTKHVVCNFASTIADCPTADLFNITVTTNNGSSISFNGSESGTPLTINPPFSLTYRVTEINAAQGFPINTIPVERGPVAVAFGLNNGFLYVANANSNNVSAIDPATNTVVGVPIAVGSSPFAIVFNPDNGLLYVANRGSNIVSAIDPATNTAVGSPIAVGLSPVDIVFNEDNGFLYVTNEQDGTVSVIDPSTNTVVATIPVGAFPFGIAFNPNNGLLYVANRGSNNVSVIAPLTTTFSEGCNGTIGSAGQAATCTVTNTYGRP
jgi:YVTN family beta-propeller protein